VALKVVDEQGGFGKPEKIIEALSGLYKPYTLKIVLTRLADLESWAIMEGKLTPPAFMAELLRRCYRRLQNSYQKERLSVTYETAGKLIEAISCPEVRAHAKAILQTGLRFRESVTLDLDERTVIGKGGKKRPVFNLDVVTPNKAMEYHTFRRGLATVGLKPHTLRKLAATRFAKLLDPVDLLRTMGWTSMNTAQLYIQEANDEVIAQKLKGAI